jgi:TonB family protein
MTTKPRFSHGSYTRRILLASTAALLGFILFAILGPDEDRLQYWLLHSGIEGPLRILPNIEIIPERDPVSQAAEHRRANVTQGLEVNVVDRKPERESLKGLPVPPAHGKPEYSVETQQEPSEEIWPGTEERERVRLMRPSQRSLDFVLVKLVRPEYPHGVPLALQSRTITVDVAIYVESDGKVSGAYITKGEGGKLFESEVLRAVRQWEYRYVGQEGDAQPFWDQVRWIFKPAQPKEKGGES